MLLNSPALETGASRKCTLSTSLISARLSHRWRSWDTSVDIAFLRQGVITSHGEMSHGEMIGSSAWAVACDHTHPVPFFPEVHASSPMLAVTWESMAINSVSDSVVAATPKGGSPAESSSSEDDCPSPDAAIDNADKFNENAVRYNCFSSIIGCMCCIG